MKNIDLIIEELEKKGIVTFYITLKNEETKESNYVLYNVRKIREGFYKIHTQKSHSAVTLSSPEQLKRYISLSGDEFDNGFIRDEEIGATIIEGVNGLDYLVDPKDNDILDSIQLLLAITRIKKLDMSFKIDIKDSDGLSLSIKADKEDLAKAISTGIKPFL